MELFLEGREILPIHQPPGHPAPAVLSLICISDIDILDYPGLPQWGARDLEYLCRYTSPGPVIDHTGTVCYPINELHGTLKVAERFIISHQ